jgi:dolichol-phosphate mannosyltransferase
MYEGMGETWREWGRSLDLKDASSEGQKWGDLGFLIAVQGLPMLVVLLLGLLLDLATGLDDAPLSAKVALAVNGGLVGMRFALCGAIAPSYDLSQAHMRWAFWLSPLADPAAVYRIFLSSLRSPKQWRGRSY